MTKILLFLALFVHFSNTLCALIVQLLNYLRTLRFRLVFFLLHMYEMYLFSSHYIIVDCVIVWPRLLEKSGKVSQLSIENVFGYLDIIYWSWINLQDIIFTHFVEFYLEKRALVQLISIKLIDLMLPFNGHKFIWIYYYLLYIE